MKNPFGLVIGIIVVLILIAYMVTYQVRYDQTVVVTTFESVKEPVRDEVTGEIVDPGSIISEPGLYFKLPWPFQKTYTYSTKLQLLEDVMEQIQTADSASVVINISLTWRVEDPLAFYRSIGEMENAQEKLKPMLGDLKSIIAQYRFDEMVNEDADEIKLVDIETASLDYIQNQLDQLNPGYGIKVESVGIRRLLMHETTTVAVFERMSQTRERIAETAKSEGEAEAAKIREEAESRRRRIMAFANRRAEAIRAEGDQIAAEQYSAFQANESFAIFLRKLQALEQTLPLNTTVILDASQLEWLSPLVDGDNPPAASGQD